MLNQYQMGSNFINILHIYIYTSSKKYNEHTIFYAAMYVTLRAYIELFNDYTHVVFVAVFLYCCPDCLQVTHIEYEAADENSITLNNVGKINPRKLCTVMTV